jgi:hypothetical protein
LRPDARAALCNEIGLTAQGCLFLIQFSLPPLNRLLGSRGSGLGVGFLH